MPSSLTWLDSSEQEKRKMLEVIDLFREQDTRDELGLGTVRDAFADLFFPGTSTIQTRARYFLFIPWIYLDLERRRTPSREIVSRARRAEIALVNALVRSDHSDGTIGIEARESLKRLPSTIYWQGLGMWGIRSFGGSQDQYHRSLDAFYASGRHGGREAGDSDGAMSSNWHAALPSAPDDLLEKTSFKLTKAEAQYLRERIMVRAPGSLLAFLVDQGTAATDVAFPWEHAQYGEFPTHVREQLEHARNFSEAIHGAALLYNLMLAEKSNRKPLIEEYRKGLRQWSSGIQAHEGVLRQWEILRFWAIVTAQGARVTHPTRAFIDAWLSMARSAEAAKRIATNERARHLIHERERQLKRTLARLENPRALELWGGAAGTAALDYRWPVTQTMVSDILNGLKR